MAAVLGLSLLQASAATTGAPDTQEAYPPAGFLAMTSMAETFTPAHSGQLYQVSLYSGTGGYYPATFYINIWSTTAGKPSAPCALNAANPLTTKESALLGTQNWNAFPLAHGVPVTAGVQYAIVVCSPIANVFRWSYENGETYAGGGAFLWGGSWSPGGTFVKAFDFKAWVSGNQAATVAANSPAVSSPEGTAPINTGTYADAAGHAVAISASSGAVTKTGTSSGTWSWTQAASDEAPTQTITITADDGQGVTTQTSFTVEITPLAPTAKILTDPVSSPEGAAVPFTGAATTPFAPDGASVVLSWAVTQNGANVTSGSGSAFSFTPADEGMYLVTLTAKDDGGMPSGPVSATLIETDITPTASIDSIVPSDPALRSPLVVTPWESLSFAGSFNDAATHDTHSAGWNFGDGTTLSGWAPSHSYGVAGNYTVTLTVTDDDNVSGQTTATVVVLTPQQVLTTMIGYVQGISSLNGGQKNSLIAKLNAASDAMARGDNKTAHNQLNAFLNELEADNNTGKISAGQYGSLRADAHAVQGALGTYNRFLEWWPPAGL